MHNKTQGIREEINHRQGLDLVLMLINYELSFSGMPENEKPDLRVLRRIMEAVKSVYPFNHSIMADRRAKSLHELISKVEEISHDESQGKFNQSRSMQDLQPIIVEEEAVSSDLDPLGDIFVVVTERDHDNPMKNRGAICFESYTGNASLPDAVSRAKSLNGKYGKTVIHKLVPVGNIFECEKIINNPPLIKS